MTDQQDSQSAAPIPRFFLNLQGLDQLNPEYVNIIQANHEAYGFQVAFARYVPPLVSRPQDIEALREEIQRDGVPAQVVCRLLVAPSILRDMVEVLQTQLDAYEQQFGPIPKYEQMIPQDGSNGS